MNPKLKIIIRIISALLLLYLFLLSIKLMSDSFKMFGKNFADQLIGSCSNPFIALFIGILATSIVQSSSTTTSIVVGLCGGGILPIEFAIPVIMGANIGTTVTSMLVSLTLITRKEDFRRAFAGTCSHDFFNLFSVILLFPLELKFHFIQKAALFLTNIFVKVGGIKFTNPLKVIIDPIINLLENFLVKNFSLSNVFAGSIMLIISFALMIFTLIYLVKLTRSLVISKAEVFIDRYLFRNDFTAFILGLGLTGTVQSSSVTTSLLVPLVGAGVVSLKQCYPFTLGANVGTTVTAMLASLATVGIISGGQVNTLGITAAFAHFMFNVCGIAVFYPLKNFVISSASKFANLAAESKRWAFIFVLGTFFVIPLLIIFLSKCF